MNEIAAHLSADEARSLTEQIKAATEQLYSLLLRAHEGQAWAALGYDSWRDYAMTEFGMSQSQAYRLLDHGRVIREIEQPAHVPSDEQVTVEVSPMGEKDPLPSERQARELAPLLDEPEKLRETWDRAIRESGGKPTAAAVKQAREHVAPRLVPPVRPVPSPPPKPPQPAAHPIPDIEIVDAEIVEGDARRDAELDAMLAETDVRFRANFTNAMAKADDVWQFSVPRMSEVYAAPGDRQALLGWIGEMRDWCDRVTETLTKTVTLRSVGGDR